ncbi:amino acid adenylation domain-containing protein [Streptomyces sp. CA-288835]|uniref:amino acid adenylation domain-containing protein n=1 Tax=Streptomyces sp. CA-288835 TaxID=3240069 RepID=UPI003D8B24DA
MSLSSEAVREISGNDRASGRFFAGNAYTADPARACHSLIRRLPTGIDSMAVRANLKTLAEQHAVLRDIQVFDEVLHVRSDDVVADARRTREACRGVGGARLVARVVVLGYADGAADLVLVADRRVVDRRALDQLATALCDPLRPVVLPDPAAALPEPKADAEGQDLRSALPWGLGEPSRAGRTGTVALTTTAVATDAVALFVAATAIVLTRYGATEQAEFALVTAGPEVATTERSVMLPVDASESAAELLDAAAVAAAGAAAPGGEGPSGAPVIGVLVTAGRADDVYRPALAPVFPVTLAWEHSTDGSLSGVLHYDEGVLDPVIAGQFAGHLCRVVEALGRTPAPGRVGDIELVDADEAVGIVAAGRTAARTDGSAAPIHELFRVVAAAQPDAPALTDADRTVSYAELDALSDAVAGALRGRGVVPGDRVGVCLDREADLVIALLGVVKAGAAYVPMDAAYPAERLAYTVADAGIRMVISTSEEFPTVDGVTVLRPNELSPAGGSPTADADVGPDDIAYVIYTSGSTGRPKGVAVPHRNVGALLDATTADLKLGPWDTWTLFHSSAFDFSVWEIWGALLSGGHLVVVPYFTTRDPEDFHDLLVRHRVTVLNQTPSAFTALKEVDLRRSADLAVRLVIFGGEPLDPRILEDWFRRHPHTRCRVVNMFGITETTVHVTSQTLTPQDVGTRTRSVGRVLPGWSVSVRDTAGRIQPFGVPGEIHVGGAGVASHYLNREELTADRFVRDPVTGERVYRSGDLGRLRPDGRLDHLGRIDGQVKVRGFRIELDEIRSVLLEDENVTAAVVVLAGDTEDAADVRLDAHVVAGDAVSVEDVRRRAARVLPDHMLPATITLLPELPLTVNGKVDVSRLKAVAETPVTQASTDTPVTSVGHAKDLADDPVLRVWREILGEHVGPYDDFFSSGGNSLLAVRLSGALRRAGLPAVSLRELYVHSTPAEVSALVSARESAVPAASPGQTVSPDTNGTPARDGSAGDGVADGMERVPPRPTELAGVESMAGESAAGELSTAELTPVGRRVHAAWAAVLDIPAGEIELGDDFFEIGGSSLAAMQVALLLDDLVTLRDVMRCSRLTELIDAAERAAGAPPENTDVLVRLTAAIADPVATVVCLPYAGGNAVHFKPVADALVRQNDRLMVVAAELPGHAPGSTEDDLRSFADTVELITAEIERTVTGPVVLWGHCNGSPLAIEITRLLTERGREVRHLFLAAMLFQSAQHIRDTLRDTESLTVADVRKYLAEWTGTTELDGLGGDFEDLVTRTFRHDALLANEYLLAGRESGNRHQLTTSCTVVMATDDPLTPGYQDSHREWELFIDRPNLHEINGGGHYFTRTRPEEVAELVAGIIEKSD